MKQIIAGAFVAIAGIATASAQETTISCGEFNMMTPEMQASAVAGLAGDTVEGQGNTAAAAVMEQSEQASEDPMPAEGTGNADNQPGDTAANDPLTTAIDQCADNPDTMLVDAIVAN